MSDEHRMVTYEYAAAQYDNFKKKVIPSTLQCMTKSKILEYLDVDTTLINDYTTNQLVPRIDIASINGDFNFDIEYIIFTFNFASPGRDLDLRVNMIDPVVGGVLGWCRGVHFPIMEPYIMYWGKDNTGVGKETIAIDIEQFKAQYPTATSFTIDLRCFWFGTVTTTPVNVTAVLFSGGTIVYPTDGNYEITISGYDTSRSLLTQDKQIDLRTTSCNNIGIRAALFTYDVNTKKGVFTAPTDNTPPSQPTNLVASNITKNSITIDWTASTDNIAVTQYMIYLDNVIYYVPANTTHYVFTNLQINRPYNIKVIALDEVGNLSVPSITITPSTLSDVPTSYYINYEFNNYTSAVSKFQVTKNGIFTNYNSGDSGSFNINIGDTVKVLVQGTGSVGITKISRLYVTDNGSIVYNKDFTTEIKEYSYTVTGTGSIIGEITEP